MGDPGVYDPVIGRAIQPMMGAAHYKTYMIAQPLATHFRVATCQEVECERYALGWRTALDMGNPEHVKAAAWIRGQSGRLYAATEAGPIVTFVFPHSQQCFEKHRVPVGRPQLFVVRDGDFRGNPRGTAPVIRTEADWVDDAANHQDKLSTALERG